MRGALARVRVEGTTPEEWRHERDLLRLSQSALLADNRRLRNLARKRLWRAQHAERDARNVRSNIEMWSTERRIWREKAERLEKELTELRANREAVYQRVNIMDSLHSQARGNEVD